MRSIRAVFIIHRMFPPDFVESSVFSHTDDSSSSCSLRLFVPFLAQMTKRSQEGCWVTLRRHARTQKEATPMMRTATLGQIFSRCRPRRPSAAPQHDIHTRTTSKIQREKTSNFNKMRPSATTNDSSVYYCTSLVGLVKGGEGWVRLAAEHIVGVKIK